MQPWAEGATIADPRLAVAVADVWAQAMQMAGDEFPVEPPRSFSQARALISEASVALVDVLETPGAEGAPLERQLRAGHLLAALNAVSADLRDADATQRVRALDLVEGAGKRLRALGAVEPMMRAAAAELCRCGFDRALLLRIEDGLVTLESAHDVTGADISARVRDTAATSRAIASALREAGMIRRRAPLLVTDARALASKQPELIGATGTRSYVAAPLFAEEGLIGVALADGLHSRRNMDEFDRDVLWLFARELSAAYEHAAALERLGAMRQEIRRANQSILAVMDEFMDAEVEVARIDRADAAFTQSAAAVFIAPDSRIDDILTRRELDVADLMAAGETNAGIAAKLVVSEGTVKSHVKRIFRKLGATNRAEAVSRIITLSR